jgi:hypothetical protein
MRFVVEAHMLETTPTLARFQCVGFVANRLEKEEAQTPRPPAESDARSAGATDIVYSYR